VPIHPSDTLERHIPASKYLGTLSEVSISILKDRKSQKSKDELRVDLARKRMHPLGRILNLEEMEVCIFKVLLNVVNET